jgi:hypothetical protein
MLISNAFDAKKFWSMGGLLLFPHVPKTGGTSIRRILSEHIKDGVFVLENGSLDLDEAAERLKKALPADLSALKLIVGHMPFGVHLLFPDRLVKYVSVVREPVERIASHYLHECHYHVFTERGELLLRHEGFVEFANASNATYGEKETWYARNDQCRVLFPALLEELPQGPDAPMDRDSVLGKLSALTKEWYALIGVQDALDEFIAHLCSLFGCLPPEAEVRLNARYGRDASQIFSATDHAVIERWNEYDRLLHNFVRGELPEKCAKGEHSELNQLKMTAEIRLKALQHCRAHFFHLNADREAAQLVMDHQHKIILRLEAELERYRQERIILENSANAVHDASLALKQFFKK